MYQVLSKDMIELEIVPYLRQTKRGFKPQAPLCEIVNAILYKLKTGVQWEYFDPLLYKERYKIERTNAWMDSFRTLLNRFETTVTSWKGFNFLAFIVIGLKKSYKLKKSR